MSAVCAPGESLFGDPIMPSALPVIVDNIPVELRDIDRWVLWRWEKRDKWTKPPHRPDGRRAGSTDPTTWSTFTDVVAAYNTGGFTGIGIVLTADDNLVGVDLDHCVEGDDVADWAQLEIDKLDSYTEISPSGTGVRMIARGTLPARGRKRGNVETYETGRYVTITGHRIGDQQIAERTTELAAFHARHFPPANQPKQQFPRVDTGSLTDAEVLDLASRARNSSKFTALYGGDDGLHNGDRSAADLALCSLLAFYTQDTAQLDRLFRGSSRMRDKWDERHAADGTTYGELTIEKALSNLGETYQRPADQTPVTSLVTSTNVDRVTGEIVEVIDPTQFFDKTGLLHASLRTTVLELGPIATGPGRTLWHYRTGVWLPQGDDEVRRRCRRLLGQRWRKSHAEGVVADLAASEPSITDTSPTRWINCRNGLLDWRTGELHPHSPQVSSTYQLAVDWDPEATCPTVDAWLGQVAPDDATNLIWEVIGTAVYPDQPFHRAVLLLGPGRNGKGTLLRLVARLIGRQHISAVTLQALGENRFVAADLFGKVANIAGDLDSRAIARTDVFKMATGGDLIAAEHKYGATFTFHNRATMLFSANEPPGSVDHTDGFFARWVVLPFNRLQLAPHEEDHGLEPRLHAELGGVLVRAVNGLRRAMERGGYDQPASVTAATLGYRDNADPLRRFVEDCLNVTGTHTDTVTRSGVYSRYREWSEHNGQRPLGANRFWGRLTAVAPTIDITRITAGTRLAGGIQLVEAWR